MTIRIRHSTFGTASFRRELPPQRARLTATVSSLRGGSPRPLHRAGKGERMSDAGRNYTSRQAAGVKGGESDPLTAEAGECEVVASRSSSSRPLAACGWRCDGALRGAPQGLHRRLGELVSGAAAAPERADTLGAAPVRLSLRPSLPCCRFPRSAFVLSARSRRFSRRGRAPLGGGGGEGSRTPEATVSVLVVKHSVAPSRAWSVAGFWARLCRTGGLLQPSVSLGGRGNSLK